ncbi:MAG: hypothetical protein AVDCRST_MAG14-1583 [uncultured Rubrobacteraceae bacterium]|uniref:Uncharacterized protein n=1 Tax=uncultured Rubrobacteraceae bacterium TaxID=349277 RepID=A0A6J4R329_9ACTN|nr:MAG: hypothetical protein AVDCRST_MAG14-1583 [uncultured Rubrobacteraceae bacterium]
MTHEGTDAVSDDEQTLSYIRESVFSGFSEETLADFLAKNRERHPIDPHLNPEGRMTCLSAEEFHSIFEDLDGWKKFYLRFPEAYGIVEFSRVGFDRDMTQALVYASHQTGWLSGIRSYWFFSKLDGTWSEPVCFGGGIS